jgi:predicted permease
VSIVAGVVISLLPARRAISLDMDEVLRGRGTAHRVRGAARTIVIVQVALSMILVVGAGLFAATLSNLYANHLQPRDHQVIWTRLARSPLERGHRLEQPYFEDLSARLAAIPGADAAAFSVFYPGYLSFPDSIPRDKISVPGGADAAAVSDSVSPGFFDLYSIALLRGRDFTWFDRAASPAVAIVNETLARQLSPASDVVGRRVQVTSGQANTEVEIVGIVADANVTHIRDGRTAGLYRPLMQDMLRAENPLAHVRVRGDLAEAQRGYLDTVNERRQHTVLALFTFDDWLDNAVVEQRLLASMSGFAAVLAVSLSALGLSALLAYSVLSRTREIGVRISIGAGSDDVARMIMREGLLAVMPGLAIGIALALGVAWALRSQFFGVSAADPRVIAVAAFVVLVTAIFASWLPARRAARVQPIEALRQD